MLKLSQIISLFVLGPFLFYPFSFCPFRLPYLYCFVCPTPCGWKHTRWIVLLIALGLNVKKDFFCTHLCPLGAASVLLFKIGSRKFVLPKLMRNFKYIILALIVVVVVITMKPELLFHKFIGLSLSQIVLGKIKDLFFVILIFGAMVSIFIYRALCDTFCPIKTLGEISAKVRKLIRGFFANE